MTDLRRGVIRRRSALDDFHEQTHLRHGDLDMRTPSVDPDTGVVTWTLRPDLILAACVKRGCRIRLYQFANGVPALEIGGET